MKWIDTHSHIYQKDFDEDIDLVITEAQKAGVGRILLPNIDLESIDRMHILCDNYPAICYPMMGLHPTSVGASYSKVLKSIRSHFNSRRYIAVGEIGVDLYWDQTYLKEQLNAFEEQLRWSIDFNLPVVIHNRDAFPYVMECLHRVGVDKLRGVFHSFGGTHDELKDVLSLENFMIGINGVVTFKNSTLRNYLALAPISRIVVETDAPYLSPVPYRGKRNEPSYLLKTAEELARIYDLTISDLSEIVTGNAIGLFDLNENC